MVPSRHKWTLEGGCREDSWLPSALTGRPAHLPPVIPALELPLSRVRPGPGGPQSSVVRPCPFPTGYSMLQAVQATMILSTILCCVAFLIFVLQLFRLKQGERFVLTSIIQLMSCK